MNSPKESTIKRESLNFLNEMKEREKKLSNIQNFLAHLKKTEINRIMFEYMKKDYQRRFSVTHEEIISVIVGEDNTPSELTKIKREQNVKFFLI